MLTDDEIEALVGRIVACADPAKVILFGSYAKGKATPKSDVDFLVVKETDLPRAHRTDNLVPLLRPSLVPVDVHVYTPEEIEQYGKDRYSFVSSVLASGKVLFEAPPRPTRAHCRAPSPIARTLGSAPRPNVAQ